MPLVTVSLAALYMVAAVVVALYSASFFVLIAIYLLRRQHTPVAPPVSEDRLPSVTLQLPIYNERHVAGRLLDAVARLDYPREKLVIQVLDDSTDDTTSLLQRKISYYRARGLHITLLRRQTRDGFKAGALAYGLEHCQTDYVGIFDADFVPAPDFLRRTMPHFNANPRIALVQSRMAHLNAGYNLLTRAQALAIDQHVAVEQVARSRGHLPMSMNGTGGIWRRTAVIEAGGWTADTLTEDLDLSYRAFLKGWRFRYTVDVAVPGEVPPQISAYKLQQARWAKGSTQCLQKHAPLLLHSELSLLQKVMGVLHLGQYAIQPFLLLLFVLTPPAMATGILAQLPLGPLGIAGLAPTMVIVLGQTALYRNWPQRLAYLPVLLLLGTGMTLNNSRAVLEALMHYGDNTFKRTPKFSVVKRGDKLNGRFHELKPDWTTGAELVLGLYALVGLILAMAAAPAMSLYMLLYTAAFLGIPLWSLWQHHVSTRRLPSHTPTETISLR